MACFVPLGAFSQRTSDATIYQQVSMNEIEYLVLFLSSSNNSLDMLL